MFSIYALAIYALCISKLLVQDHTWVWIVGDVRDQLLIDIVILLVLASEKFMSKLLCSTEWKCGGKWSRGFRDLLSKENSVPFIDIDWWDLHSIVIWLCWLSLYNGECGGDTFLYEQLDRFQLLCFSFEDAEPRCKPLTNTVWCLWE